MFDAKSLLEQLVAGSQSGGPSKTTGGGDLGSLLGQLLPGTAAGSDGKSGGGLGDLEGMLRNAMSGGKAGSGEQSGGGGLGGLGDLLGGLTGNGGKDGKTSTGAGDALGGLGDMLGKVLGQATSGAKEGASKVNDATGASDVLRDLVAKYGGGRTPEELIEQVKKLAVENKLGTGAALGGLGALVLGTQTGRSIAVGAAKIGALALIGGLAYKAYENHQNGRPLISADTPTEPPPEGSGFEPDAVTNDDAVLYIRAMIAAAAADGRIDPDEQQKIISNLSQSDIGSEAEEFLATQMNEPASIENLAAGVSSHEQAVQVYTAARIAIDPDTAGESAFLAMLASRLCIDDNLAAHIDAAAKNVG